MVAEGPAYVSLLRHQEALEHPVLRHHQQRGAGVHDRLLGRLGRGLGLTGLEQRARQIAEVAAALSAVLGDPRVLDDQLLQLGPRGLELCRCLVELSQVGPGGSAVVFGRRVVDVHLVADAQRAPGRDLAVHASAARRTQRRAQPDAARGVE